MRADNARLTDDALSYPTGRFTFNPNVTPAMRRASIDAIRTAPAALRKAVQGLSDAQLDTPYRPGGWTVRQVVHHVADSHMNSYIRTRLALTESNPAIAPYDQERWASLPDSRLPAEVSLQLLDSLHQRWVVLFRSLSGEDFQRTFRHPEQGSVTLTRNLALYAWHGLHHEAHIAGLRSRMGWK